MNELEQARIKIDEIDQQIAQLFEQRMKVVEDVIKYKIENKLPILDSNREKLVIEKNLKYLSNKDLYPYFESYIKNMMDLSKQYQHHILNKK